MTKSISQSATVQIEAPPAAVWEVLVDIDRYAEWNRYATSASGDLEVGGTVTIMVPQRGEKYGPVANRVTEVITNERLCWRSLGWYRFLVYGERCRYLEEQSDGSTLFREVEVTHGPLANMIHRTMGEQLRRGLQTECDSLREAVEARQSS